MTDSTHHAALEHRLQQIADRLTPCPRPDIDSGWDLCAHALPWPCPTTEAAWIAHGADADQTRSLRELTGAGPTDRQINATLYQRKDPPVPAPAPQWPAAETIRLAHA